MAQSIMVGKSSRQELETASPVGSAVRNHRMVKANGHCIRPFYTVLYLRLWVSGALFDLHRDEWDRYSE